MFVLTTKAHQETQGKLVKEITRTAIFPSSAFVRLRG
jgi:hypothetical protein